MPLEHTWYHREQFSVIKKYIFLTDVCYTYLVTDEDPFFFFFFSTNWEHNANPLPEWKDTTTTPSECPKPILKTRLSLLSIIILGRKPWSRDKALHPLTHLAVDLTIPSLNPFWDGPLTQPCCLPTHTNDLWYMATVHLLMNLIIAIEWGLLDSMAQLNWKIPLFLFGENKCTLALPTKLNSHFKI